jgi:hypothetical protein
MAYATRSKHEATMRFAAPMWGLVQDHAVAVVQTDDDVLIGIIDAATDNEWRFNSEWTALGDKMGERYALRVDLAMHDGTGVDLTLTPTQEDVDVLQGYELLEVWIEYGGDPMACSFRTRPRRSDILTTS